LTIEKLNSEERDCWSVLVSETLQESEPANPGICDSFQHH